MRNKIIMAVGISLCLVGVASIAYADSLASRMSGKILLQVEENGEAWYVSPDNSQRYFLGRPEDAFQIMRKLGLGISNSNLEQIPVASDSPAVPSGSSQAEAQASAPEEKSWKVTHMFKGTTDISTEPFTFKEGAWVKIKYSLVPEEASSYYSISLQNNSNFFDQDLIYNEVVYPNTVINDLTDITLIEDTTNLYNKQVNSPYHFEVSADGGWVIEAMEYTRD
jgi:hypothetical protein